MENIPTLPAGSVMLQNGPLSLYHSSTDILAMERPIALTSSDIAALDINPSIAVAGGTNAGGTGGGHTNNIPPTLYSRLVSAASASAAGDDHSQHHHHPHPHPHHHHQLVAMGSGNSGLPPANFSVANVATYPKPQYMNSGGGVIGTTINPSENGQQLFSLQQQQQLQAPAGPNSINPAAVATSMMSSLGKSSHMFPPVIPFHETAVRPVGVGDQTLSQDQQQQQHAATAAQLLSLGATALLGRVGKNPVFLLKTQPSGFFLVFVGIFFFFWFFYIFI
jgi:hypothetical protein